MTETDKLTDMVYEDEEVRKSVEKRRELRENVEEGVKLQTVITNETSKGTAFYFPNINEIETNKDKDTRYGEDA